MLTDAKVAAIKPPAAGQDEHRDAKVTGLRLRVGTSGKKTWIVRARAGAKIINKKLGTYPAMRLGAARTAAEGVLEAIAKNGSTEAVDRTFGAVADAWLEAKRAGKTKTGNRNKSVDLQQRRLELHVLPKWRDRKLADITIDDVDELVEGIEGKVLPNRVLTVVRTVFGYAVSKRWLPFSPASAVGKPKHERPRDRFLDMVEVKRVWDASALLGYPYAPYVRALMLTGQRRTEVAGMRWSDVDLDAGTWLLQAEDTKGERAHLVPLSAPMVEMLRGLPRLGDQVFTTDGETHIAGFAKAKVRLDAFLGAGGDPLEPWTLHDLRRTAATHMVRLGVSIDTVGRILNHAPAGVTRTTYVHEFEGEKRAALDRWAAELTRAVQGGSSSNVVPLHA